MCDENATPLTPGEIKKLAKKIVSENPIYIPDEPEILGAPDSLGGLPRYIKKNSSMNFNISIEADFASFIE